MFAPQKSANSTRLLLVCDTDTTGRELSAYWKLEPAFFVSVPTSSRSTPWSPLSDRNPSPRPTRRTPPSSSNPSSPTASRAKAAKSTPIGGRAGCIRRQPGLSKRPGLRQPMPGRALRLCLMRPNQSRHEMPILRINRTPPHRSVSRSGG